MTTALLVDHRQADRQRAAFEAQFRQQAHDRVAAIHREVNAHLLATRALSAFYLASNQVTPDEFRLFATTLLSNIPSLQALEWIPEIPNSRRHDYEANHLGSGPGQSPFHITERNQHGQLVAASTRSHYYPVDLVEPFNPNATATGFDLASEPVRKEALERARDSCAIAVSGPIALVQQAASSDPPQAAFLSFIPVYRQQTGTLPMAKATPDTLAQRRRQLLGFVLAVSRVAALVDAALAPLSDHGIALQLTDITQPGTAKPLYRHGTDAPANDAATVHASFELNIGGRQWQISASPASGLPPPTTSTDAWLTLFAGLLLTLLLTTYVHTLQTHTIRLDRLKQREQLLSHCNHSLARAVTEQELLDAFCRILVQTGPYQQAGIDFPTTTNDASPAGPVAQATRTLASHLGLSDKYLEKQQQPAILKLPLQIAEQTLGTLRLLRADHQPITTGERQLLADIAAGLAFGIATRRAREAEHQRVRRLREDVEHEQRMQLAASLHDGVGQSIQAIVLGLKRLRSDPNAATNPALLSTLISESSTVIEEFRDISHQLRPFSIHSRDLREAIQHHCDSLNQRSHIPIECSLIAHIGKLAERTQEQCFLAFREALSNALRHANASRITITLMQHQQKLQLTIKDNGIGFDPNSRFRHPSGLGLSMIAERCHSVGAHADISSDTGTGTTVTLSIPIPATNPPHNKDLSAENPATETANVSSDGSTGQAAIPA